MKKLVVLLLAVIMLVSVVPSTFAQDFTKDTIIQEEIKSSFTKDDILKLSPYVSVEKGYFVLDSENALRAGHSKELIKGQQSYFDYLNKEIQQGNLAAKENLEIINLKTPSDNFNIAASCEGISTAVEHHWWGYSRYMDSCEADRFAADLASAASVATGVAVVAAYFGGVPAIPPGLGAAYFALVSSRVSSNNAHGTGIFIEMTWVLVFDITPQ
ncbi:hypothetical protein [Paenibacillus apis]|uniref:Uncharacterized protein n=1 Tax=Paenibacillus apis TaxID=1792174 RepID=A0A919Y3N5_9BACL|nr:hypothetical protein [Paenibacillus apis]GIO41748.1 hypothetical protein J41TS4_15060 [Paenibacillus apis]